MTEEEKKALEEQQERERLESEKLKEEKEDGKGDDDKQYGEAYVKGLREENAKWRKRVREIEERLEKLDGVDPDEYQQLKEAQVQAERDKLAKNGEFDKIKDQLMQGHAKELGKKDEEIIGLKSKVSTLEIELHNTILDNAITIEAAAAKCLNPALLALQIKNEAKIEITDDGRRVIKLLDDSGTTKFNSKGDNMSVKDRIAEMKQDEAFAMLFEGGIQGAGSGTGNARAGRLQNPWKKESFNLTKQGQIIRENPDLAKRFAAEVGIDLGF